MDLIRKNSSLNTAHIVAIINMDFISPRKICIETETNTMDWVNESNSLNVLE